MKSIFILVYLFMVSCVTVRSQSVYQLSFKLPAATDSILYNAFFINYNDGKGLLRIKYTSPVTKEDKLVEADLIEETGDLKSPCYKGDRIFYQLQNIKYIGPAENNETLPAYICFKLDTLSAFFEPHGISSNSDLCKNSVTVFNTAKYLEQSDLSKDLVLEYFSTGDELYKNIFETRTKGLTINDDDVKLYLLVVANTNDTTIGQSCDKDMKRMVETFKGIADFLHIQFFPTTVYGTTYNRKNVDIAIDNLHPGSKDIVVFYYSGHGFRRTTGDTRYAPYIDLRVKNDTTFFQNSKNMEDIFNTIRKKGARLNLVLADCCNGFLHFTNNIGVPPAAKKGFNMNMSDENCRNLFLNADPVRVSILATAASPGQLATSNNKFGGFFSYFFKTALENHLSIFKNNVTWKAVFEEAKNQTKWKADHTYCELPDNPDNVCNQLPYIMFVPSVR